MPPEAPAEPTERRNPVRDDVGDRIGTQPEESWYDLLLVRRLDRGSPATRSSRRSRCAVARSANSFRKAEPSAVPRYPFAPLLFKFGGCFLVEPFPVAFAFLGAVFFFDAFFAFVFDPSSCLMRSSSSIGGPTFLSSLGEG